MATTVLSIIKAANTGLALYETVGPWLQGLIERGGVIDENTVVTDEDLKQASIDLGVDIDQLDAAIKRKELRDAQDSGDA